MRCIPLGGRRGPQRGHALIDDEDYDRVSARTWYRDSVGYAQSESNGERWRLHRFLLELPIGDPREVDHANGNKLDNRRANLRITDRAGNCQNLHLDRELPRGVYLAPSGRFYAQVKHRGQKHCLGHFDTPEEAGRAADAKRSTLGFLS